MALLVQGVKSKADVEQLRSTIKMDIKVFGIRKQYDIVAKLEEILYHLNTIQAPSGQVADPASSVAQFEAELFSLAEDINQLISEAKSADSNYVRALELPRAVSVCFVLTNRSVLSLCWTPYTLRPAQELLIQKGKATRARITGLAQSMRTLRTALEKQNDQANTRTLNAVEDLQENLADLEYTFKSGFEEHESSLYSMFKEQQVSTARRAHQTAEKNMFEL
jgi:hypothetical protein